MDDLSKNAEKKKKELQTAQVGECCVSALSLARVRLSIGKVYSIMHFARRYHAGDCRHTLW